MKNEMKRKIAIPKKNRYRRQQMLENGFTLTNKKSNLFKAIIFFAIALFNYCAKAQTIKLLTSGIKTSIRGLSAANDRVVWASGSGGMVAVSSDSGNNFKWHTVKGFEKTEFRDIEAFDEKTAVIMGIDSPGVILKTFDAGETWKVVFENHQKGIFLDAMDFYKNSGVVLGDPIDGKFFMARTSDFGDTWHIDKNGTRADFGEAAFASSGTNILKLGKSKELFVSGGLSSHLFVNGKQMQLPILQGKESTGANSIAAKDKNNFMIVGGDFNTKDSTAKNCLVTKDAGNSWIAPLTPPTGYRSCVVFVEENTWITCGLNGTDISKDDGAHFTKIDKQSFNVCTKSKKGSTVFFAGNGGKIGKLIYK